MALAKQPTRQKQNHMLWEGGGRNNYILLVMLFTMGIFWLASFAISIKDLPDYQSYEQIYEIGGLNYLMASTDLGFVAVIQASKILNMDYEQFRSAILLASLTFLSIALILVYRWLRASNGNVAILKLRPFIMLIASVSLLIFMLEFLLIRIRAGLGLSLVSFAFALYLTAKRPNKPTNLVVTLIFYIFGYSIHGSTAIVLGYLLFLPILYKVLFSRLRPFFSTPILKAIIACVLLAVAFYFVFMVSIQSVERGENVESPLNGIRLLSITVAPLLLAIFDYVWSLKSEKFGYKRMHQTSKRVLDYKVSVAAQRKLSWIAFSTHCYLALAFALLILYTAGFITESGEAIVRVFTLSSVPAIFVILLGSSRYSIIWLFLLLSNALFFLNTLATPM